MVRPLLLNRMKTVDTSVSNNNIPVYAGTTGMNLTDSGVSINSIKNIVNIHTDTVDHISNNNIHVTKDQKERWDSIYATTEAHVINSTAHITQADRNYWDNKESIEGAQLKANIVQSNLSTHINNTSVHVTNTDKSKWNNTYSKEEIDNKFATLETSIDWKEAVNTFDDLDIVYPSPWDGWTVNVLDTDITYRFNGEEWIAISANAIPLATEELNGMMAAEMVAKLNTIEENANNYTHPNIQINDAGEEELIWHVTQEQADYWNAKAESVCATFTSDGLMSKEDRYKLAYIEDGATNYVEPEYFAPSKIKEDETHRFVSQAQIDFWNNKAETNVAVAGVLDGLMSMGDKAKLNSIQYNANYYVHPTQHEASIISTDEFHRFVTDSEKIAWNSKANSTLASATEDGLLSSEDKLKIDTVEEYANYYVHPEQHLPTIIKQDKLNRFVTDEQILSWTAKKDSDKIIGGTGIFNSITGTYIAHDIGHTTYYVSITPTEEPINVGDIWVVKENDYMIVMNNGTSKSVPFDWTIIVQD